MDENLEQQQESQPADPEQTPAPAPANEDLPPASPVDRRQAALERIAQTARRERGHIEPESEEPAAQPESGQQQEGAPAGEPAATAAPGEPSRSGDQPGDQLAEQLADDGRPVDLAGQRVTVKVDGHEREVPIAELVRAYQINSAADRRLQSASELLRATQALVHPPEPAAPAGTVDTVPAKPDLSAIKQTVQGKVKDALGKVLVEGEEAAAGDLTEAMLAAIASVQPAPATPPSVDTRAIADAVAQQIEQRSALQGFLGTYTRIADNPYLQAAADDALARVQQAEPELTFADALKRAGDEVYQAFGYQVDPPAVPQDTPAASRADSLAAKKAGMKPVPIRTGSSLSVSVPPMNSEQSRSATIAEMAARRRPPGSPMH